MLLSAAVPESNSLERDFCPGNKLGTQTEAVQSYSPYSYEQLRIS